MAISANNPRLSNQIKSDVPEIQQKEAALLKMDPTNVADLEVGAKRLTEISSGNWQFQTWNGSQWVNVGKLKMDVDTVDGYDASITPKANTVAVRGSNGKLQDSITGNAATADSAVTISTTLEVGKGGTGATSSEQARRNLDVPPTSHASANTTYGISSESVYGHAKASSDAPAQDTDAGAVGIKTSEFARGDHSHKKVLGNASTYGQVKLTDSVSDGSAASSSVAASAKAVKDAYNAATEIMVGASDSEAGKAGIVPAPQAGQKDFFLRGDGTWAVAAGLPLGHFFTWPFSTPPDGSIVVNGATYSRTLYADLWTYISSKSDWVKTESEWQSIASANGGYCPYYSDGDGSTTFRVPKFAPYQQIALSSASAGTYHEAGLPNITGHDCIGWHGVHIGIVNNSEDRSGALSAPLQVREGIDGGSSASYTNNVSRGIAIDASLSSPVYGKSTTVQPESNEWIVCVVAYGRATNVGNVDVANVMSAVGTVQSELTNYLPLTGGNVAGTISIYRGDDFTGRILATNDKNSGKSLLIDTWEEGDRGAFLRLQKGSDKNNPGGFIISARNADGTIYRSLTGHTNGDLWWDGKRIVRSVNGVRADVNGNVNLQNVTNASYAEILRGVYCLWANGPVTLPNYGTWAYIAGTHYRGWGGGSSDGACWGGTASGGTTINVDSRGTAFLAVRIG